MSSKQLKIYGTMVFRGGFLQLVQNRIGYYLLSRLEIASLDAAATASVPTGIVQRFELKRPDSA